MSLPRSWRAPLALAFALTVFSACGDDDGSQPDAVGEASDRSIAAETTAASAAAFPVTLDTDAGPLTITQRPDAIISLSATATEMLFAIGAGPQVIAVDDQSNFPPEAPRTDLSGYTPNIEAIAAQQPDLVVISDNGGGLVEALGQLDIPVLLQAPAADLAGSYAQIEALGEATGNAGAASTLVTTMRSEIDTLLASLPQREVPLRIYHELDDTYFSVSSSSFIGQVYELLGFENIADAADAEGTGYPQLSAEYIVDADPDVILLADTKCCQQDASTVAARPGWGTITAVETGTVVLLDDDVASRWGPRILDFIQLVVSSTAELEPVG